MENITEALAVTVFGVLIVFAVLLILMLILSLMKLFAPSAESEKKAAEPANETAPRNVATDDVDEIIAVLTAAIAASYNTNTCNFKIRSYKRLS